MESHYLGTRRTPNSAKVLRSDSHRLNSLLEWARWSPKLFHFRLTLRSAVDPSQSKIVVTLQQKADFTVHERVQQI